MQQTKASTVAMTLVQRKQQRRRLMVRLALTATLAAAALWFAPRAHAQDAGAIERLSGNATIVNAANQSRPARSGDALRVGDTVNTQAGGEVLIKFKDDSTVALRQNTQMKLNEFRFDNQASDGMLLGLLKGSMRAVSGLIGKATPRNVRYSTATATVGIRGTDVEIAVVEEDSGDTRAGTYDYVYDGATNIQIASGQSLDVAAEQTGLALANPRPGEDPLQLLRSKPAFLSGGGFDALILQLTRPMPVMPRFR